MSSVIVAGAIIGGAMGFGGGLYGVSKGNRQLIKAFNKQMYYAQLNYNYNQAQLTNQQVSLYHNAMGQLAQLSYNAYLNNASVQAAQAQTGYEGRTSQAISRTISGQSLRQKTAVKDSYQNSVANVRAQKDALYIEMKNNVEQARQNLSNSFTHGFNAFMQVLDSTAKGAAAGAFGGAVAGAAAGSIGGAGSAATGTAAQGATQLTLTASSGAAVGGEALTIAGSGTGTIAPSVASSSGWLASLPKGSFMSNFNTLYTQNQGLFNMFGKSSLFTSSFNRRGGNYY